LDEIGVVYNIINKKKILAVFIPNKFFHFLHEMNFERLTTLMRKGKIDKDRTLVVLKTLASTPAIDKWAGKRKEEGFSVEVINTAVGFSKLANVMYRTEGWLREHPGEDVIITDASGKDINIGKDPIIIAAWEESGGIIIGITYGFEDLLGKSFLAEREKSATESILLALALLSKLQKKNGKVDLARYLKELYERDDVDTPIDIRFDNKLYVPDTSEKAALEENEGQGRKNRIFGAYLAIVISYMKRKLRLEEIKPILKDLFIQEYEARKVHEKFKLDVVLLERFKKMDTNSLVDIKFTGDGVMFIFEKGGKQWFVLFRPSGTEPKLKSYGFGSDTKRLTIDTWAFAFNENVAGILPESFISIPALMDIWGSDGTKAVEKSRRMQIAWDDFGLVVDPTDDEDLKRLRLDLKALKKRRLVRSFNPPDDHLERINQWLKEEGLSTIEIDLTQPQAMPQEAIVDLLQAIPDEVYKKLGRTKEKVLDNESKNWQ
jgi:hypothetical protein